ncbi:putative endonuclease containing a URI domain containing protein [Herbaspirillum sp. CF444]|uniref:GIY-YIG nuclease family protein n=1 Tax=Herbaspirillum sp. CF444 TaxID=1144319 RepID=UPI0002724C4F|nr:GIY-YIG nuclease family protein [Herbaspirillum sp. CF444]EJL83366.1 putative endonuclease containing a URI domain containing protein [Herbaspirillum sp. CF444]
MSYFAYILASQRNGSLYIGVTNDLVRRVYEHKHGLIPGFTQKYGIRDLVYVEVFDDIVNAITREKQRKAWRRAWQIELIEKTNPYWNDLYATVV